MNKAMMGKVTRAIADSLENARIHRPNEAFWLEAKAVLSAIQEDYAIVPREASQAMLREGADAAKLYDEQGGVLGVERQVWAAMVSAAERTSQ